MKILPHTLVAIRYRLRNLDGHILESIMDKGPVHYVHGSGAVLPSLDDALLGMQPGDTKTLLVTDNADHFYVDVVIDSVRAATEQEIRNNNLLNQYPEEHCGPDCIC
jgi:FKBP-type peptidyl-prolyl cis-trans isomerases 2